MALIHHRLPQRFHNLFPIPKSSVPQTLICKRNAQTSSKFSIFKSLTARHVALPVHLCGISVPPVEEGNSPSTRIFVKGLSPTMTEGFLAKTFSHFGKVSRVKIIMNKKRTESLGFAYIWFTNEDSAQSAVNEMDGQFFCGRFIAVTIAKPEAPSSHVKSKYIF